MFVKLILHSCEQQTYYDFKGFKKIAKILTSEAVVRRRFAKELSLKISQNSPEKTCGRISFFINLQAAACNFTKIEILAQVFSCKLYEIFKNTVFYETPPVAASGTF